MKDEYCITCESCGSKTFELEFSGIHIKAICENCGEVVKNDYSSSIYNTYFIKQLEDEECEEEATTEQLRGIRYRAYHEYEYLTKTDAGDIIGIFERAKKKGEMSNE
jgi:transcription initiation factor TFIIIB Brf1 subunit/transcription initiation factor TFIIB